MAAFTATLTATPTALKPVPTSAEQKAVNDAVRLARLHAVARIDRNAVRADRAATLARIDAKVA